jgi:hypothetical protein
LKTVCTHPTGDLINAGENTFFQLVNIIKVTRVVNFGVVSIKMGAQTVLDDNVLWVSRVEKEQNWAKHWPLRYTASQK